MVQILQLDVRGMPQEWITPEDAATYYATDSVAWTVGSVIHTLHGGTNAVTGLQSRIDVHAIVATTGMVWVFLFAHQLMGLFTDSTEVVEIGATYLRIATIIFYSYVIMNISISVLQGIKKPMFAIWIGLYRQIIMPLALFPLFAGIFDLKLMGIWWVIACINWSAAIISLLYIWNIFKKMKPDLPG